MITWLLVVVGVVIALVVLAFVFGLFARPAAPKVPGIVLAGATIRIEDGGSPRLMLLLHPLQFQVSVLGEDGRWRRVAVSKETKKHRWVWKVPEHYAGKRLRFTASNECPVSGWGTKPGPGTERTVYAA